MKKISILFLVVVAALSACKKTPEVNLKYVDIERDLITVGTTTATVQCDYEYITTLKKAYLYYGEGTEEVDMNTTEMCVVQNTLYVDLAGLSENTTYSYYYEFVNGFNSMRSETKTFKTETSPVTPPEITLPTVVTSSVTEITANSAKGGGEVTDDGGADVTERGICWSTNANPTLNDSQIAIGTGIGEFTATVSGLDENTTYHIRAYAINEKGTAYGLDREFTTLSGGDTVQLPLVITNEVTGITAHSAICGGEVTNDGGAEVTERGICWSASENPTLSDSHVLAGNGVGTFAATVTGLNASTTYHVRAYATNEAGTAYGLDKTYTTLNGGGGGGDVPTGAINGLFTIDRNGRKVYFSQGNLQYVGSATTPYWKFAENQWEILLNSTEQASNNPHVDRDRFGWGTSGWNNGNLFYQPYNTETNYNPEQGYGYGPTDGTNYQISLEGEYSNADWGIYNAINNGGNMPNQWHVLTNDQWGYILEKRQTSSGIRYVKAYVNDRAGIILLPDEWDISIYEFNYPNASAAPFSGNVVSMIDWAILETSGAVFLPVLPGNQGFYWSSTLSSQWGGAVLMFRDDFLSYILGRERNLGSSVRLVQDTGK